MSASETRMDELEAERLKRKEAHWASVRAQFPDDPTLICALKNVFVDNDGAESTRIKSLRRQPNIYSSTSPSETVQCIIEGIGRFDLLIKYTPTFVDPSQPGNNHSHRGGLPYEADIYSKLLVGSKMTTAKFYGAAPISEGGRICLVFDYLRDAFRVNKIPGAIEKTTQWIAKFHREMGEEIGSVTKSVNKYDIGYYQGWVDRACALTSSCHSSYPWLPSLVEAFKKECSILIEGPQTVIHGEFTSSNILILEENIYPIDWESAAIAAGEIDLASLLDGWGMKIRDECMREYVELRWPGDVPIGFRERFDAGRMYWHFRWLGDEGRAGELARGDAWHFEHLQEAAKSAGLL